MWHEARASEAISWHVLELLRDRGLIKDKPVERVVFNEVTKSAIIAAMGQPRTLDTELIDAYRARRALDYLVGFSISPVLWRKLPGARSAGRVQSVALRLICEREAEIEAFIAQEYWTVEAELGKADGRNFIARLTHLDGKKLAKHDISSKDMAIAATAKIEAEALHVIDIQRRAGERASCHSAQRWALHYTASCCSSCSPRPLTCDCSPLSFDM